MGKNQKTATKKEPKYKHKIWYHKSMLLASVPVLREEIRLASLNPIIDNKQIKDTLDLINQYENLLNKDL